ncbi:MAG: RidA family protein [Candidimonas sp.]|nr:MAG: RidA family protein [Candidimonas sp.]TAM25658.1 MAG: RidA family protein [Candidimonas sp.]
MEIKRIGRNPAGRDQSRSRASQISIHGGTVYFAATPDRPFDAGAPASLQMEQLLRRVDERLELAGSDKSRILMAHVMISDMRFFGEMNEVWDAWVDQVSPPVRACCACDLGSPDMKVEIIITAALT